jgi:hypothetical protein
MGRLPTIILVVILEIGCGARAKPAGTSARATPAQATTLEDRVQQYWKRRQAKDLAGAYPFYCAAYRARVSQTEYLQLTRLARFDLSDVRIAGTAPSAGGVAVTIAYRFLMPTISDRPLDGHATEIWTRDAGGEWCKQDEPVVLPFPR